MDVAKEWRKDFKGFKMKLENNLKIIRILIVIDAKMEAKGLCHIIFIKRPLKVKK